MVNTKDNPETSFTFDRLDLDGGGRLAPVTVAYRTYGTLNADKSNAILICHALTGDQYVAEPHPVTGKPGWWHRVVGPGKIVDTEKYYVICGNAIGGCMGSTGPASENPATGKPYGLDFPVVTFADMVRAQKKLVEHLGIKRLFAVIGASTGGRQALEWAARYPDCLRHALVIASSAKESAQNIAFHEVGRQAVMADPDWKEGKYLEHGTIPRRGLAVARMGAHIAYLSETSLHRKFGRRLQDRDALSYGFDADFQIESYLRHQGASFVERFDANSYLYLTRAADYFDLEADYHKPLSEIFRDTPTGFCILSFSSDWFIPTSESREIIRALSAAGAKVSFAEIETDKGHDAFLLDEPQFHAVLQGYIDSAAREAGIGEKGYDAAAEKSSEQQAQLPAPLPSRAVKIEHELIAGLIPHGARVLDVGCGDGALLSHLTASRAVRGAGLELDMDGVRRSVAAGLPVIQGDADSDLGAYPDNSFDYVILSHTLQAMKNPGRVLEHLVRIGRRAIVSFPNFGHWKVRADLFFHGRMPVNETIPYSWHETPNIHFCTISDFDRLCEEMRLRVERRIVIDGSGSPRRWPLLPDNLTGEQAVYLVGKL